MLQNGSHGSDVRHWQEFIGVANADGEFGPKTEVATKNFQKDNRLTPDGKVGPATLAKAISLGYETVTVVVKPVTIPSSASAFEGTRIEQINAAKLAKVAPALQTRARSFIAAAAADGVIIQITQGLRTFAEQDALFAKRPVVTKAQGGQSNHNYGTAIDVAPVIGGTVSFDEKLYRNFGKYADAAGLSWGGRWAHFTDLPHLELPGVPKPSVLIGIYRQGGLAAIWEKYGR